MSDDVPTRTLVPRWIHDTEAAGDSTIAAPAPTPQPAAGELLSNARYQVGREIGRGGMGRVVAATDLALERPVAIKQVLVDDAEHIARFEREARITAKLAHPAVVPVFDVGRDPNGRPFYVMRKIEGTPLDDKIASAVTVRDRLSLLPSVLAAVDAAASAHAQQIVHRDIKPANILLGPYGETLLIDWGLARDGVADSVPGRPIAAATADEGLTRAGHAYGTIGYMAPEQARGEQADARADVYALGATLYHVVTGKLPSGRLGATAWLAKMVDDPQPLRIADDDIPAELGAIVTKSTMPERDDRYADAGELARDLRRFLGGQLVAAHRYTARQRIARFVRRHKVAVAAITVAVITVTVIAVTAITGIVDARDDAQAAQKVAESQEATTKQRTDQLLLEQAQRYVDSEPERAIALIQQIRPGSPEWPGARDALSDAASHGVPHGVELLHGRIIPRGMSLDGRRVIASSNTGLLVAVDLPTREVTTLKAEDHGEIRAAVWAGETVVAAIDDDLVAFDPATGRPRALRQHAEAVDLWPAAQAAHVYYRVKSRSELHDLDLVSLDDKLLSSDAVYAEVDGDAVMTVGVHGFELIPGGAGASHAVDGPSPTHVHSFALSSGLRRAAAVFGGSIVEWDLDTGTEVRRVAVPEGANQVWLHYTHDRLIMDHDGSMRRELLGVGARVAIDDGHWDRSWFGRARRVEVFATDTGDVILHGLEGISLRITARRGLYGLATSPHGDLVVAGSDDGVLYWWDTSTVVPEDVVIGDAGAHICQFDGKSLVFSTVDGQLRRVELASGEQKLLWQSPEPFGCLGPAIGGRLGIYSSLTSRWDALDLATGTLDRLGAEWLLPEPTRDSWFTARGKTIVELEHGHGPPTVVWDLPEEPQQFARRDGEMVAALVDGRVLRRDAAAAIREVRLPDKVRSMAIDREHTLWLAEGHEIWRWPVGADAPAKLLSLGAPPQIVAPTPDGGAIALLDDGELWIARRSGAITRVPGVPGAHFALTPHDFFEQDSSSILTVHLSNGRTSARAIDSTVQSLFVTLDRQLMVSTPTKPGHIFVFRDSVPDDQQAAQVWIDAATNFAIDPVTGEGTWVRAVHSTR